MMPLFGRSRRRSVEADPELTWPDDDGETAQPVRPGQTGRPGTAEPPEEAAGAADPSALAGREPLFAGIVGGVLVVVSILMLVVTKGAGAPAHIQPLWPALGLAFGLATLASLRWGRRLPTAIAAIVGGFGVAQGRTPTSLVGFKTVGLLAPVAFGMIIFRRQSKADKARRAARPRVDAATRKAEGSNRGPAAATGRRVVPGKPIPSGRYTPPKARRPPRR